MTLTATKLKTVPGQNPMCSRKLISEASGGFVMLPKGGLITVQLRMRTKDGWHMGGVNLN